MKKIAIITGASSGMGREFALTLEKHLQVEEVWAVARSEEKLSALALGVPVRPLALDLTLPESLETLGSLLEKERPRVMLLVNAGGFGRFAYTQDTPMKDALDMVDLNCRALTQLTLLCLPFMGEGSSVLNIASVAAFQPTPGLGIYAATKAYVLSFTRALAREVRGKGIRVMALCPFWTKTAFFDRAKGEEKNNLIRYYAVMYSAEFMVEKAWKALLSSRKDVVVPGLKASLQVLAVKLLPHSLVMTLWQGQQKMNL